MNRIMILFPLVAMLAACGDDTDGCAAVKTGHWVSTGNTWGMEMDADVEVAECNVTFSNWNMRMSVPAGATISGDQVTLEGDAKWSGCIGTVQSDTLIEGTCADDSTWGLSYQGATVGS